MIKDMIAAYESLAQSEDGYQEASQVWAEIEALAEESIEAHRFVYGSDEHVDYLDPTNPMALTVKRKRLELQTTFSPMSLKIADYEAKKNRYEMADINRDLKDRRRAYILSGN
ncbi:hypothetical protein SAMN05421776_11742 [Nocardia farcinica]|uniref:Uncharacterized protein n=1 Tax=Nocardia farcinica TaxID=37329 RepID=A0A0H5P9T6_NOCFR|nr:hypothetical protein [Nocardia farcinica]AXK86544.1 hypothetical protein DXT66_13740 [Nocardia farcinica]PFW99049.1 hypothetical protein CJ469_05649 [Nocardia farcinica]PFX06087.1 hypothetical protein CJ468_04947 [Nocardia farcinica]CRY79356.1 Uncharacterised protein [Nocardia farcinica]CRY79813.1 Uncharacterised protein [Nocardia farcinica]